MDNRKDAILEALRRFARQRPGMEPMNYGDWRAYRNESASVTRDLKHAEELLNAVAWRDGIGADEILAAARGAYSGRLSIECDDSGAVRVSYCTGQYFPTEYRKAVCRVLSCALWDYWRKEMELRGADIPGMSAGDYLRKIAARELSRGVASRYFR